MKTDYRPALHTASQLTAEDLSVKSSCYTFLYMLNKNNLLISDPMNTVGGLWLMCKMWKLFCIGMGEYT